MLNLKKTCLLAVLTSVGTMAQAGIISLDDFTAAQTVADGTINGGDERNTVGNREVRVDLQSSIPPPSPSTVTIGGGTLDVINGTGEDSEVEIRWSNLGPVNIPVGATNLRWILQVIGSDGNPTTVEIDPGGTRNIDPNFTGGFNIPVSAFTGGDVRMRINGAPGWDLALSLFGIQFDDPAAVPVPGVLALLGIGFLGLGLVRRERA